MTESRNLANRLIQGWGQADASGLAAEYTQDSMALNSGESMVLGRSAMTESFAKSLGQGTRVMAINSVFQNVWVSGKYVFSIDKTTATLRVGGMKQLLMAYLKCLEIQEIQPDGSLKIKVDSWNLDNLPTGGPFKTDTAMSITKDGFHCPADNAKIPYASVETLDKIRQLEKELHTDYAAKGADVIAGYYADDVILLPNEDDFVRGREQVKAHTVNTLRQYDIQGIGDNIICIEGTEEIVFVVNTYNIKLRDKTQEGSDVMDIPCKGVHVWQKQPDGSWKILMDMFNSDRE